MVCYFSDFVGMKNYIVCEVSNEGLLTETP